MKYLFIVLLVICSINSYCQKGKIDSIYYLLDTANTSYSNKIWSVHHEYPSLKIYTIECPCLPYESKPTFVYRSSNNRILVNELPESRKLIGLIDLINLTKKVAAMPDTKHYAFFIIEPEGKSYAISKVELLKPVKSRSPSIDLQQVVPPRSKP